MHDVDVLVIGGGLSGLATGWWLGRAGISHEIWERDDRAGGKIASCRRNGYLTEGGASIMFNYRPEVSRLLDHAGLTGAKRVPTGSAARRRYVAHRGALVELRRSLGAVLGSSLWSWRGRLRMLAEPFIPRGSADDESIAEFVRRRLGTEFLERVVEPFVAAVYAADPERTQARAALPRLTEIERRYGSLAVGILVRKLFAGAVSPLAETFSFRHGMAELTDTLAAAAGARVRLGHRAIGIEPVRGGWRAVASTAQGTRSVQAAQLVLSAPAHASAALLRAVEADLADRLARIEYVPLTVVHLGVDRQGLGHPLDGGGFLVPRAAGMALTAVQWPSSLFPERAPPGKVLLAAFLGGARCPQTLEWSSSRCLHAVQADLARWLGMRSDPEQVWFDRHARALPLFDGAQRALRHALDSGAGRPPGLHLVGNYLGGISTRDCIVSAADVAARIADSFTTRPIRGPCMALTAAPAVSGPV
ncbi:MAG: protoporphyrinogen oxidase [Gammaproteobacteria bacterium]|nr:protoporphyrinogen oxidase [Gammaproteobacteria bacterium]